MPLCGLPWRMQNRPMALEFTTSYLSDSLAILRYYKKLGDQAIAQVLESDLTIVISAESNSIAIIVKHLAGNMLSRWPDFLSADGEKAGRDRDAEFEAPPQTRAEIVSLWDSGWKAVFDALTPLTDADLNRTIRIRSERHSVMQAVNRQITHYSYHVGQIVFLAKHLVGARWTSLSIPRGKSADFNARVGAGKASQR
jgi:Protein of unknown function (DUF1572)